MWRWWRKTDKANVEWRNGKLFRILIHLRFGVRSNLLVTSARFVGHSLLFLSSCRSLAWTTHCVMLEEEKESVGCVRAISLATLRLWQHDHRDDEEEEQENAVEYGRTIDRVATPTYDQFFRFMQRNVRLNS